MYQSGIFYWYVLFSLSQSFYALLFVPQSPSASSLLLVFRLKDANSRIEPLQDAPS
jgi:uncharacterized membrane protein YpjA